MTGDVAQPQTPSGLPAGREEAGTIGAASAGSPGDVTRVLRAAQAGDPQAAAELLPLLYAELRELARARMAGLGPGLTLQPTALVHEAYLRVADRTGVTWEGRRHFFFAAARAMRDILVEQARRKAGPKAGGGRGRRDMDPDLADPGAPDGDGLGDVLAVHEAVEELERVDPLKARIVTLRYFAGLTVEETADVLGESERSLHRHWRFAKAWLKSRLQ